MQITTEHSMSSYGQPVILDDSGHVMDYAPGITAVRHKLGLSRSAFGTAVGVSPRTVEAWEQGLRIPSTSALLLMARLLEEGN